LSASIIDYGREFKR